MNKRISGLPLARRGELIQASNEEHSELPQGWDVFISYASEDRQTVAAPLANALMASGLAVWFDQFEIRPGDSLFASISEGIRFSRFGVVVFSPDFLAKGWTQRELRGLFSLSTIEDRNSIIPVWHKMTAADIAEYSPLLSDIRAVRWDDGLEAVVQQIMRVASSESSEHTIPISLMISADVRRSLSKHEYLSLLRGMIQSHGPDPVHEALSEIVLDIDQLPWIRVRALEVLSAEEALGKLDWMDLLQQPITDVLEGIIRLVTETGYPLNDKHVSLLFANPGIPQKSTGNIGEMIEVFVANGAKFNSQVFVPLATSRFWETKYNCVKAIIRMDDTSSISVLNKFSSMSYWQARRRIIRYIDERRRSGRLSMAEKALAVSTVKRITTDGKTEEGTRVMRLARELSTKLTEDNSSS